MDTKNHDKLRLCRACLVLNYGTISLNSKHFGETSFLDLYKSITNIESINVPEEFHICLKCTKILICSYNFQQKCLRSNQIYDENLQNLKQDHFATILDAEMAVLKAINDNLDIKEEIDCDGDLLLIVESDQSDNEDDNFDNKCRNKKRSKIFPAEQVLEAIKEYKESKNYSKTCMLCQLETVSYLALATHMSVYHTEHKGKWCIVCNSIVENLEDHKKVHVDIEIICKFCEKLMKPSSYISHLKTHLEKKPFECKYCKKNFARLHTLRTHVKLHLNLRPYKCPNCTRAFVEEKVLRKHVLLHGPFKCENCSVRFKYQVKLKEHICAEAKQDQNFQRKTDGDSIKTTEEEVDIESARKLFGDKALLPNYCNICNRRVKDVLKHTDLFHSKTTSENSTLFTCSDCGKNFKSEIKMKIHARNHEEGVYGCSYCDKKCKSPSHLKSHERTHTREKPFICNVCGKGFAQGSTLKTHMFGHGEKPEICKICHKRFCRKTELRLHMKKHEGIKPFLCPQCGKSYSQKSHLTEHCKTHSEDRPFQCPHCEKAFKLKTILDGHLKIHTGEKLFRCEECFYECYTQFRLSQHRKQHNKSEAKHNRETNVHFCLICKMAFPQLHKLNIHMATAHKVVK